MVCRALLAWWRNGEETFSWEKLTAINAPCRFGDYRGWSILAKPVSPNNWSTQVQAEGLGWLPNGRIAPLAAIVAANDAR